MKGEMEDLQDRYEIIEEAATDAIVTLNEGGTILSISKAAEQIFGFKVPEMAGHPIETIVPDYKRYVEHARSAGASLQVLEVVGRRKGGKEIHLPPAEQKRFLEESIAAATPILTATPQGKEDYEAFAAAAKKYRK